MPVPGSVRWAASRVPSWPEPCSLVEAVVVAWAGQKRLVAGERIGPVGRLWWNVGVALGIHGVDPLGALVRSGSCEECQTSEESWSVCAVGYHTLVR